MSQTKALMINVGTAVATAIVMGAGAWTMGVFEAGSDALSKEQIKAVIAEVLVTDSGDTYGKVLSEMNVTQATILTKVTTIEGDVKTLEASVLDLAGGT